MAHSVGLAGTLKPCPTSRSASVRARPVACASAGAAVREYEDRWIGKVVDLAEKPALGQVAAAAAQALKTIRVPTTRNESYRFTSLGALVDSTVVRAPESSATAVSERAKQLSLSDCEGATVVLASGAMCADLSNMSALPKEVYVGPISGAPQKAVESLGLQSAQRGGPFATLNSAMAPECLVIHVPKGCTVAAPLHVIHLSASAAAPGEKAAASPRMLVVVEEGGAVEVVEEFAGIDESDSGAYFVNATAEVFLETKASLAHKFVVTDGQEAVNLRATLVEQQAKSAYSLTEVRLGGVLTRHDVNIVQLGPETSTTMRHFALCAREELHDLHTQLVLDHPSGVADQLHKCIVAHAKGQGVFDGNVQVNRGAQKTDAAQLCRNLLLVPRATVNVKPNLQIIADDVKCTHGCTVSDLEDEQVFYFQSRGIDAEAARAALVYSFGMEVVEGISQEKLRKRLAAAIRESLDRSASV